MRIVIFFFTLISTLIVIFQSFQRVLREAPGQNADCDLPPGSSPPCAASSPKLLQERAASAKDNRSPSKIFFLV